MSGLKKSWRKRYEVWIQARPRDEGSLYAARCRDCSETRGPWLTNYVSKERAWEVCEEHEHKHHLPAMIRS
jgi:hypothetical protein